MPWRENVCPFKGGNKKCISRCQDQFSEDEVAAVDQLGAIMMNAVILRDRYNGLLNKHLGGWRWVLNYGRIGEYFEVNALRKNSHLLQAGRDIAQNHENYNLIVDITDSAATKCLRRQ